MSQNSEELQHHGVPGMKWGKRKARYTTDRQGFNKKLRAEKHKNKAEKTSSNKQGKQWSTKKKVAVGAAATVAIIAGVYGAKKLRDYVRNENDKIATEKALKAYTTGWENWKLMNGSKYDSINNSFSPTAKKLTEYERGNILKVMSEAQQRAANDSYREAYDKVKNVNFRKALSNVIDYKRKKY